MNHGDMEGTEKKGDGSGFSGWKVYQDGSPEEERLAEPNGKDRKEKPQWGAKDTRSPGGLCVSFAPHCGYVLFSITDTPFLRVSVVKLP
jgi:hypothetical protein